MKLSLRSVTVKQSNYSGGGDMIRGAQEHISSLPGVFVNVFDRSCTGEGVAEVSGRR